MKTPKKRYQKLMLLLLALLDSRTKPDLLVSQRSLLLGNDLVGAIMLLVQTIQCPNHQLYSLQSHHDRLVLGLFLVCGTARSGLLLLALHTTKLLPALSSLLDTLHPLLPSRLGLLPRSKNLSFGKESVRFVFANMSLGGFQSSKLALGSGATAGSSEFLGCLETKFVEKGKVCGCKNLCQRRINTRI